MTQFEYEDREYEQHLQHTEIALRRTTDVASLPDRVTGGDSGDVLTTLTGRHCVYTIPDKVHFKHWGRNATCETQRKLHLLVRNTSTVAQPVVVTHPLTKRFHVVPVAGHGDKSQLRHLIAPDSTLTLAVLFDMPRRGDPEADLWDNFQDCICVYTRFHSVRVPLRAFKTFAADKTECYPQESSLILPGKPSPTVFKQIDRCVAKPSTSSGSRRAMPATDRVATAAASAEPVERSGKGGSQMASSRHADAAVSLRTTAPSVPASQPAARPKRVVRVESTHAAAAMLAKMRARHSSLMSMQLSGGAGAAGGGASVTTPARLHSFETAGTSEVSSTGNGFWGGDETLSLEKADAAGDAIPTSTRDMGAAQLREFQEQSLREGRVSKTTRCQASSSLSSPTGAKSCGGRRGGESLTAEQEERQFYADFISAQARKPQPKRGQSQTQQLRRSTNAPLGKSRRSSSKTLRPVRSARTEPLEEKVERHHRSPGPALPETDEYEEKAARALPGGEGTPRSPHRGKPRRMAPSGWGAAASSASGAAAGKQKRKQSRPPCGNQSPTTTTRVAAAAVPSPPSPVVVHGDDERDFYRTLMAQGGGAGYAGTTGTTGTAGTTAGTGSAPAELEELSDAEWAQREYAQRLKQEQARTAPETEGQRAQTGHPPLERRDPAQTGKRAGGRGVKFLRNRSAKEERVVSTHYKPGQRIRVRPPRRKLGRH